MNKTKLKYVKYTNKELDRYVRDKNSCINLVNSDMHIGFPPWGFANFQETLTNIISRDKIGKYDPKLNGIVLDLRNIKVFGTQYPVHDDDPYNHININANFYVFQPRIGATIKGIVKHISHRHVAVIIYRVFNVSIRFNRLEVRETLSINQQISFRIKKFDLHGAMPYIEGELIEAIAPKKAQTNAKQAKHTKFEDDNDVDGAGNGDSGISTEETSEENRRDVKKIMAKVITNESESSSDSESESDDSDAEQPSLLPENIKIKEEKFSGSEEEARYKNATATAMAARKSHSDSSSSSSSSDDDSDDEEEDTKQAVLLKNLKKEKRSPESSSDSSSSSGASDSSTQSDSDEGKSEPRTPITKIKKEKDADNGPTTSTTSNVKKSLKSRSIKSEPASDVEGISNSLKKPSANYRRSLNVNVMSETPEKAPKRKRNVSMSEQLDNLIEQTLSPKVEPTATKSKRKSLAQKTSNSNGDDQHDESMADLSTTTFLSPALSSTLISTSKSKKTKKTTENAVNERSVMMTPSKIKQELFSEDESSKRKKKKSSSTSKADKTLKSIQDDLFDSFLK